MGKLNAAQLQLVKLLPLCAAMLLNCLTLRLIGCRLP